MNTATHSLLSVQILITDAGSSCCPDADNMEHETRGMVQVQFIGVNHPPQFPECDNYAPSLFEHSPVDTGIINVSVAECSES